MDKGEGYTKIVIRFGLQPRCRFGIGVRVRLTNCRYDLCNVWNENMVRIEACMNVKVKVCGNPKVWVRGITARVGKNQG